LALAFLGTLPALASYSFSIPKMELDVTPQPDASVRLYYSITFQCEPGGQPIDVVDIGLPHSGYSISSMKAMLGDQPLTDIRKSTAISTGVEVHLPHPIQPGKQGRLTFSCVMPDLVYQDTTNRDNASLRITPTWYDGQYLVGKTDLWIIIDLPLSVKPEEVLYQLNLPFTKKGITKSNTFVAWQMPDARMDGMHLVGLSFPKRWMERVIRQTPWGLAWKWWRESSGARVVCGLILLVLLGIFYFRLTRGTGCTLYGLLVVGLAIAWAASPVLEALSLPALVVIWILVGRSQAARRRDYLPAIASTPGGGIKRGLTVPEAAVLLEVPLGRVLTLVLFGMLKKGLLKQTQAQPLIVEPAEGYTGTPDQRREAAKGQGSVIRGYEQEFLDALAAAPGKPVEEVDFKKPMKDLIDGTVARMAGFELAPTREYYKSIIAKAWADAKQIGDLNMRTQFVDDNLLWMMMAPNYDDEFGYWGHHGYYYYPSWTRLGGPVGGAGTAPASVPVGGQTSLGDVGASFAGWAENLSGRVAGSVDPVSLGIVHQGVDLSGVDHVTGEMLESLASSSGSGGGGGGGCACAGCACACACAGGGR
jgi:hypothetical protein